LPFDFELLCEVISRCLGNKPDSFRDAWPEIRDEQVDTSSNNSLVGIVLENYLREPFTLSFDDTNHRIELKLTELHKQQFEYGKKKELIKDGDTQFHKHQLNML
jgi:hypothetical protein